jgi:hypothetical protein
MEHTRKKYARKGMTLYNGEVLAKSVCLGVNDNAKNWREITDAEAEAIRAAQEMSPDDPNRPTEADYLAALGRLGVEV